MRKRTVMKKMLVQAKMSMEEQAGEQALADVKIVSVAAAAGEIAVPHGKGACHRALIADHKPPLLQPGLLRSP